MADRPRPGGRGAGDQRTAGVDRRGAVRRRRRRRRRCGRRLTELRRPRRRPARPGAGRRAVGLAAGDVETGRAACSRAGPGAGSPVTGSRKLYCCAAERRQPHSDGIDRLVRLRARAFEVVHHHHERELFPVARRDVAGQRSDVRHRARLGPHVALGRRALHAGCERAVHASNRQRVHPRRSPVGSYMRRRTATSASAVITSRRDRPEPSTSCWPSGGIPQDASRLLRPSSAASFVGNVRRRRSGA